MGKKRKKQNSEYVTADFNKKPVNIVFGIMGAIGIIGFVFGGLSLKNVYAAYSEGDSLYEGAANQYVEFIDLDAIKNDNSGNVAFSDDENSILAEGKCPFSIDFVGLKEVNHDVVGWITIEDTPINYPIVMSHDNEEYLTKSWSLSESIMGAIFMDASCNGDFSSENTIIHGHNMKNGSMFRALNNYVDEEYYKSHPYVWICTPTTQTQYAIISVNHSFTTTDAYFSNFVLGSDTYAEWLEHRHRMSYYECEMYNINLPCVTLSTCVSDGTDDRMVLVCQPICQYTVD